MPKSVLVPVDGSNFAEHALPFALGIARRTEATLHLALVHVLSDTMSRGYPLAEVVEARDAEQRDHDAAYMQELTGRLRTSGMRIRPALLKGNVGAALARQVESEVVDLVVMTTHGRGGLQRAWLGSTADYLVRHSLVPLLLIRPSLETRTIDATGHPGFRRVLVALDGSETAETALRDALEIGITRDALIVLAHIVQPPVAATSPYLPHTIQLTHDEMAAREAAMKRYLADLATERWLGGRRTESRVLVDYHPAPAILDLARELDVDLVVLGTHGRGGLRRMILGSVADKVIRGTDRPVLVHRGVGRIARFAAEVSRRKRSEPAGIHPVP